MNYKPDYTYIPPISWAILTPLYDFFCAVFGLGKRFKQKVLEAVPIQDGSTVIDIGCGTGVFLKIAQEKCPNVRCIGIDPDRQALAIAQRRLSKAGMHIELKEAFAESLPLSDASANAVFSTLAFHHMPDEVKRKAVREIYRVLKPGGIIVIADFGESKSIFLRKLLFFENLEYLEGNLNGLIPKFLTEQGFKMPDIVGIHFPGIKIIKAQKP